MDEFPFDWAAINLEQIPEDRFKFQSLQRPLITRDRVEEGDNHFFTSLNKKTMLCLRFIPKESVGKKTRKVKSRGEWRTS